MQILDYNYSTRAFSALISSPLLFKTKKGESGFLCWRFYGRFLSVKIASTAKPMIITTIMAMTEGTKYMSATDVGVGVGVAVAAGACATAKEVSVYDGQ